MTVDEAKERLASVRHSWSKAGVLMEGFKYTPAQEIVRADIQALDTLLTAYEAREADSKRLDHLDTTRQDVIQEPIWDGDEPRLIARAWGIHGECDTIREAIDNAMLGMEAPAS